MLRLLDLRVLRVFEEILGKMWMPFEVLTLSSMRPSTLDAI